MLNPVAGDQTYVPPPVALSVVLALCQIVTSEPAFAVGSGLTVMVCEAVPDPFPFVAVSDAV